MISHFLLSLKHWIRGVCLGGLLFFCLPLGGVSSARAVETMDLPLQLQFKLLIKAATYNRAQRQKDPNTLRVGLIYSKEAGSETIVRDIQNLFGNASLQVRKYAVEVFPLVYENASMLKKLTTSRSINVYYVAPGNSENLTTILNISQELQILTTTGVSDYVYDGVHLGVANNGSRPEFLYNRTTAQSGGTDFHANFLRLVKVVN